MKGIEELPGDRHRQAGEGGSLGIQLATVFHKVRTECHEKCVACKKLADAHPDWQSRDVAEFLHVDGSSITRMLSFTKCITAWKEAFKAGTVGMSDVYAASKLPESEQAAPLALKLSARPATIWSGQAGRNATGRPRPSRCRGSRSPCPTTLPWC